MKSLYHLTLARTLHAFIGAISLHTLISFLPLAIGKNVVRLPEADPINRLNTESYGITVTL
jgi:hypothetical protein